MDDLRNLPLQPIHTVRTAAEAIAAVLDQEWDEIWLDFDLGGKPYEKDDELTIMPFINVLETKEWTKMPVIYIHTMNPVGRQRIVASLKNRYEIKHVVLGF